MLPKFAGEIVKVMNVRKVETVLMLLAGIELAVSSQAQTDHVELPMPTGFRVLRVSEDYTTETAARTTASPNSAKVEFQLPPGTSLKDYRVLEHQANLTCDAVNVTAKSSTEGSAQLATGSTLLFVEKEPKSSALAGSHTGQRQLFSTYFVKAVASEQAGQPLRTVSGTLNMFADTVPTLGMSRAMLMLPASQ